MLHFLFQTRYTDPAFWEMWAALPLVAYLLITLVVVGVGAARGWWFTPQYVQQLREELERERSEKEALHEENAQQNRDIVRLADRFDNAFTRVMAALLEKK